MQCTRKLVSHRWFPARCEQFPEFEHKQIVELLKQLTPQNSYIEVLARAFKGELSFASQIVLLLGACCLLRLFVFESVQQLVRTS